METIQQRVAIKLLLDLNFHIFLVYQREVHQSGMQSGILIHQKKERSLCRGNLEFTSNSIESLAEKCYNSLGVKSVAVA